MLPELECGAMQWKTGRSRVSLYGLLLEHHWGRRVYGSQEGGLWGQSDLPKSQPFVTNCVTLGRPPS